MAKVFYLGVIERDPGGGFGVSFPDLPGCVSAGDDLAEAVAGGQEALELHLEGMREDGLNIPDPSPVTAFDSDEWPEDQAYKLVMFPVDGEPARRERSVKANITINEGLLNRIDAVAQADGLSRSGLIALATRQWLRVHATPLPTPSVRDERRRA